MNPIRKLSEIRLLMIAPDQSRRRYAAGILARDFSLVGIVCETPRELQSGRTASEDQIIKLYDEECSKKESEYFDHAKNFPQGEVDILRIAYGSCNEAGVVKWIESRKPDYVLLFGAGIIREPLLGMYNGRMINLHLGLTPYYRGSANAFWPLVHGEPECLGATVHLVTSRVDGGDVLGQARPDNFEAKDGPRDVSNKNLIAGVKLLSRCVKGYANGTITPTPQQFNIGRVFRHKDYSGEAISKLKENFSAGMIGEYLRDKPARDKLFPIIEV